MKILLLGKNGQIGWELQRALAPLGEIIALDRNTGGNLSDLDALEVTVNAIRPDVIVNAAAYTAVDKAETESRLAAEVNKTAPELLAKLAKRLNALLVHYSTDYIFDGTGQLGWKEDSYPGPLNIYGKTKLDGELAIQASGCSYLIFRTSWVYAAQGSNFVKTIIRLAENRSELNIIADQVGAPTSAELISDVTAHAIRVAINSPVLSGIYHLTASGEASWYDYACFVVKTARQNGYEFEVKAINKVSSSEYLVSAERPLNSRLNCTKLEQAFSIQMPGWEKGVERMLIELKGL